MMTILDTLFEDLERLINEHEFAVILMERMLLLKEQYHALEKQGTRDAEKVAELESQLLLLMEEVKTLKYDNEDLRLDNHQLHEEAASSYKWNPRNHVCSHCGSLRLKQTGSRPNLASSKVDIKDAIFLCENCGKESVFIIDPSN